MTWEESDRLTWDEREVLLAMADKRATRPADGGAPTHVPAADRLAQRVGG